MTIAYAVAFLAMLSGFFQALLLAAVFSGIVYPLYLWIKRILGDRDTLASLLTITLTLFIIVVPLIIMLGLIAEQAVNVAGDVTPWIEMHLDSHAEQGTSLPDLLILLSTLGGLSLFGASGPGARTDSCGTVPDCSGDIQQGVCRLAEC